VYIVLLHEVKQILLPESRVLKMILSCSKLYNSLINIFLFEGVCKVELFTVDYSRTHRSLHVRLFVVGELIDC